MLNILSAFESRGSIQEWGCNQANTIIFEYDMCSDIEANALTEYLNTIWGSIGVRPID